MNARVRGFAETCEPLEAFKARRFADGRMASTGSVVLEVAHVLGATVLVGYFAILPMWKSAATRSGDPGALRSFLVWSRDLERRLVLPAIALLLLTGFALTAGPYAVASLVFERWPQASIILTLVLAVIVFLGMGTPAKKMLGLVEKGEGVGPAMDKLWGEWRTSLLAGALLSIVSIALMVYKGSR